MMSHVVIVFLLLFFDVFFDGFCTGFTIDEILRTFNFIAFILHLVKYHGK